ncbi:EAL domain-containing protein [Desulfocurvus sp.]|jgi:EAL domain-containing protein (putative c-di-GMP-specific phosphodiesterase class I)|uniref:EAL domain-containing protein n=1 Tax=Desulfocurvus sp. TaxID=2871698 RepID=UPI0025C2D0FC|nr:EAL domain-containing protein [Desulfocurvus sp.]MCK9238899.1 EAL domain-containing protein [Desulfocurvus sp.]
MPAPALDHRTLAREDRILTLFQPMISIKAGSVVAVEALSRGIPPGGGPSVPPDVLFRLAATPTRRLALDRLCRQLAMRRFAPVLARRKDLILSVNLDMSLVGKSILGSGRFLEATRQAGLNPANVVIEIIESRVRDAEVLDRFIKTYRGHGFLIALDDIGTGHSNLDRVSQIKPDIIKIDKGLIRDIHREYHRLEIAKALVRLARSIGALVVAEGVEQEAEVLELMALGVDIFQGFYFARPAPLDGEPPPTPRRVASAARSFRRAAVAAINAKRTLHETYDRALRGIAGALGARVPRQFDQTLTELLHAHEDIECMYVLNTAGRQVSATVCNPCVVSEARRFIYRPAPRGTDHSLKEYFLPLSAGLEKYTTEPYLSLASGNLCSTISARFADRAGRTFVLCVDISVRR